MLFLEGWYLLFLACTALAVWLTPSTYRPLALLAGCFVFHWHNAGPAGVAPIIVLSTVTYATLRWSKPDSPLGKSMLAANIGVCVAALIAYRYTGLWARPLAISFFTFEFLHLLADRSTKRLAEPPKLKDYLLFIFFFPSLAAGPIKRFEKFSPQIPGMGWPGLDSFCWGAIRVLFGFFKKLVLARWFRTLIPASTMHDTYDSTLLYGFFIYGMLYLDLSAYCDIAIGSARMLGFKLPENVDWIPGVSSFRSYWSRWHISVTQWFRDYVFYPLARRTGHRAALALSLIFALALSGLWHGPRPNYLLWGVINGIGLLAEIAFLRWAEERGLAEKVQTLPWRVVRWVGFQWFLLVEAVFFFYPLRDFAYQIGRSGVF
jgi:alginate O-acetyltransferase complex protein AlgI